MATVYQETLYQIFGNDKLLKNTKYFNKTCYGEIDKDLRLKAYIDTASLAEHYTCIRLQVINRIDGVVDKMTIHFKDIWDKRNGRVPYIWGGCEDWYVDRPTGHDMLILYKTVKSYIEIFKKHN